jgi:glycosyltransferase involved in cell wall biosynthesis
VTTSLGDPLVAHVVANGVRGDSRVLKSAQTSQSEGYESLIIGISLTGGFEAFEVEGVPVLLVPIGAGTAEHPRSAPPLPAFEQDWPARMRPVTLRRAIRAVKRRPRAAVMELGTAARRVLPGRPVEGTVPGWATHRESTGSIVGAFCEALSVLKPRLVHVHDLVPLPAAVAYSAAERSRRRHIWTIYDAHESAPSLVESEPESAYFRTMAEIEADFIDDANEVITVSTSIARLLKRTYGLAHLPGVVTNAPSSVRDETAPSLREIAGVPDGVPLAVYSGWIAPERGLDTVIRALPEVPELHLAIVCSSMSPGALEVYRQARNQGVEGRVHMVGYVSPAQVTQYLSSATLGLIPRKAGGHLDLSLPTKYREYLHAGIPLVVSSNKEMDATTKRTGVGRVFRCGNVGGLALQLQRVLAEPDRYRSRITPELLAEHSWERQASILGRSYRQALGAYEGTRADSTEVRRALRQLDVTETGAGATAARPVRFDPRIASVRLGIGPANSASQAYQWAEAIRREGSIDAESFAPTRAFNDEAHRVIPRLGPRSSVASGRELGIVVARYTHVLVDGFSRLFGTLIADSLEGEITLLRRHGIHLGLIAHGSEIRDPDRHLARIPGSYFGSAPPGWVDQLRTIARANIEAAASFDGHVFVSTPDLLLDVPSATWLPLVVDVEAWGRLADRRPAGQVPRVLHQPSRSDPPIKGTDVIVPVLDRLQAEGLLEIVAADDAVPHAEMPALVERADIVVDQIRTGSYGVAAVEAMAAGRVVVGHVADDVRALIPDAVPLADAEPAHFEDAMRALLADPDRMAALAEAGPEYVATWHDGRRSAETIRRFVDATITPEN